MMYRHFEKMFLKDHTIRSLILVGDTLISQIRKVLEHTEIQA